MEAGAGEKVGGVRRDGCGGDVRGEAGRRGGWREESAGGGRQVLGVRKGSGLLDEGKLMSKGEVIVGRVAGSNAWRDGCGGEVGGGRRVPVDRAGRPEGASVFHGNVFFIDRSIERSVD